MTDLLAKVQDSVQRRRPSLTVRRGYDRVRGGIHYEVRVSTDVSQLEKLGRCDELERDEVLQVCRDSGYVVDEVVEGRTWVCRPMEGTP